MKRLALLISTAVLSLPLFMATPVTATSCNGQPLSNVGLGAPGVSLNCTSNKNPIYSLLEYVINFAIRLLLVLAVIAVVVSGIQYILSQGNPDGIKNAKNRLTNAIIGLVLLSLMFVILHLLGIG